MPLQPVIYLALSFRMMINYIHVTAIEVTSANGYLVVSVTKNNALVASTIKYDANGLQCIDLQC